MVRKIVTATVSAALCMMSVTPAMAQTYRYSGFDAPRGATATLNLRVPLGREAKSKSKATYGLTVGLGQTVGADYDGRPISRAIPLADLRFSGEGKLDRAKVATFDLANLDDDKRMNLTGEGNTLWIVVGLVAAGVAVCLLADCFEGDDDSDSSSN
jgi:hypothetical protein